MEKIICKVEGAEWLKKRPKCIHCHEHIQDEYAYLIDGEWVCEDCLKHYRKLVVSDVG